MSGNFAPDYVQVNERIVAFREKYPEGSLQAEIVELTETRVVMKAFAYRSPDDVRPGIGYSSLGIPGKTPYTRDSELENCETSAWGRALAALGFEVKRAIASQEEVANKAGPPARRTTQPPAVSDADLASIGAGLPRRQGGPQAAPEPELVPIVAGPASVPTLTAARLLSLCTAAGVTKVMIADAVAAQGIDRPTTAGTLASALERLGDAGRIAVARTLRLDVAA